MRVSGQGWSLLNLRQLLVLVYNIHKAQVHGMSSGTGAVRTIRLHL